jgi:ATP-dependent DNA helicase RecQ
VERVTQAWDDEWPLPDEPPYDPAEEPPYDPGYPAPDARGADARATPAQPSPAPVPARRHAPAEDRTPLEVLREVWGYDAFRGEQAQIIDTVVAGQDALVLMPTGGGKSLCYQVPALVRHGTGVVVSPLIALMQDQVDALSALGVRAGFLNSTQDLGQRREVERALLDGDSTCCTSPPSGCGCRRRWRCWTGARSACSRSTRRTACPSGGTTSAPTTSACRCCTSAGPASPGSR